MDTHLNFLPVDREIKLDPQRVMFCKFTAEGVLEYVNDYFTEVTGYEVYEIVGTKIENLKHPDLPMTIFNYIMEHLSKGENINILMKDKIKDGRYYWYLTDFQFKKYDADDKMAFISNRKYAPREAIPFYDELYQKLIKIEKHSGLSVAKSYFEGFLEENHFLFQDLKNSTTSDFSEDKPAFFNSSAKTEKPIKIATQKKKKSLFDVLFKK